MSFYSSGVKQKFIVMISHLDHYHNKGTEAKELQSKAIKLYTTLTLLEIPYALTDDTVCEQSAIQSTYY